MFHGVILGAIYVDFRCLQVYRGGWSHIKGIDNVHGVATKIAR